MFPDRGSFHIAPVADAAGTVTEADETNNVDRSVTVTIAAPVADLVPSAPDARAVARVGAAIAGGRRVSVPLALLNEGNVSAAGTVEVSLFASTTADPGPGDNDDVFLGTFTLTLRLRPGARRMVKIIVPAGRALAPGQYYLRSSIVPALDHSDRPENNFAVSPVTFAVN